MTDKEKLEYIHKALCFYRDLNKDLSASQYNEIDKLVNSLHSYINTLDNEENKSDNKSEEDKEKTKEA